MDESVIALEIPFVLPTGSALNILYLHQYFSTREGSGGTRSYEFAQLLRQRGHNVTVVCGNAEECGLVARKSKLIERRQLNGLKIILLNVPYSQQMGYGRRLMAFAWFMLLASWVAALERGTDIIFATSTPLTIAVPAIIASFVRRLPFVFEVRDLWPEVPIGLGILRNPMLIGSARALERLAYRRATKIVALSPGIEHGIVRTGIPAQKVTMIPNASDNELFDVPTDLGLNFRSQHSYLMNRHVVLYTGAFGLVNGLDYLVRLAERVRFLDENIVFLLVGAGKEKQALANLARDLGVLNRTLWLLDDMPRHKMPEVLSAATIATSTVIPNPVLWHNSANKFFDALAAGRPIVINHGGWLSDLIQESGAGIVLPPDDVGKAAEILTNFLHSESRLMRARRAAKDLARNRFDRNTLAIQLERVLLESNDQTLNGLGVDSNATNNDR